MVGLILDPVRRASHRYWWAAILIAVTGIALAVATHEILGGVISRTPYITFFPAVVLATYLGGRLAGWLTLIGAFLLVWYYDATPFTAFIASSPSAFAGFLLRVFIGLVIVELIERLNIALKRTETLLEERDRLLEEKSALLRDRETLFLELRHRISNNLQMVIGLLRLQARTLPDNQGKRALEETGDRLQALAKIHRDLHRPQAMTTDFAALLQELAQGLASVGGVAVTTDLVPGCDWDADFVVRLTMVAQELISNAIEHGISGIRGGRIEVSLRVDGEQRATLTIRDNGAGLPTAFDRQTNSGFGMRIVDMLTQQIGAELSLADGPEGGTEAVIQFTPPPPRA